MRDQNYLLQGKMLDDGFQIAPQTSSIVRMADWLFGIPAAQEIKGNNLPFARQEWGQEVIQVQTIGKPVKQKNRGAFAGILTSEFTRMQGMHASSDRMRCVGMMAPVIGLV